MDKKLLSLDAQDQLVINTITSYLSKLDLQVPRVAWNEEQIRTKFARRSAERIQQDGNVHYANPCIDLSLVSYQFLQEQHVEPSFLMQTHINYDNYSSGNLGMHFIVPFIAHNKNYFLEFRTENQVILSNKPYQNTREQIDVVALNEITTPLNPRKNLFENLNGQFDASAFDFDAYIDRLVRTSLAEGEFEDYQKRIEKTPRLYLQLDF